MLSRQWQLNFERNIDHTALRLIPATCLDSWMILCAVLRTAWRPMGVEVTEKSIVVWSISAAFLASLKIYLPPQVR